MSSPVAEYVKNNPAPHLVRCFIEPRFYPYPMLLYQECRSQGSSQTPGLNLDGGELIMWLSTPPWTCSRLRATRRTLRHLLALCLPTHTPLRISFRRRGMLLHQVAIGKRNINYTIYIYYQYVNTATSPRHMDCKEAQRQVWRSISPGKSWTRSRWSSTTVMSSLRNISNHIPPLKMQTSESMTRAITPKSASSLEVSLLETKVIWSIVTVYERLDNSCSSPLPRFQVVRKFATPLRKTDPNVWTNGFTSRVFLWMFCKITVSCVLLKQMPWTGSNLYDFPQTFWWNNLINQGSLTLSIYQILW